MTWYPSATSTSPIRAEESGPRNGAYTITRSAPAIASRTASGVAGVGDQAPIAQRPSPPNKGVNPTCCSGVAWRVTGREVATAKEYTRVPTTMRTSSGSIVDSMNAVADAEPGFG